jgi:hypothetical protein
LLRILAFDIDRPIALSERAQRVMIRIAHVHLVHAAVAQVQLQLALLRVGNYNRFFRQGQARILLRVRTRQEDAMPMGGDCRDILNVQNQMRKTLVENARLDLKRCL